MGTTLILYCFLWPTTLFWLQRPPFIFLIVVLSIPKGSSVKAPSKTLFIFRNQKEMEVVVHEAISPYLCLCFCCPILQTSKEIPICLCGARRQAVSIIEEDIGLVCTPLGYMVWIVWDNCPCNPWHIGHFISLQTSCQ